MARECGECSKCCEGFLSHEVYGQPIHLGSPCRFTKVGVGCSIYEQRPQHCDDFRCGWLSLETVPESLYPNQSNAIIVGNTIKNLHYVELVPAGEALSTSTISEFIVWGLANCGNIVWRCDDSTLYWYGSSEFDTLFRRKIAFTVAKG